MEISLKKQSLLFIVLIASLRTDGQVQDAFKPLELYSEKSNEMQHQLRNQLHSEYPNLVVYNKPEASKICYYRSQYLMKSFRSKFFIKNERMESLLNKTVDHIVQSNNLSKTRRIVLILNNPEVNALCYGRGLFIVTIGLLSRVHNEDELASILCHELAHDELQHVQINIIREADQKESKIATSQLRNVFSDDATTEDVVAFRKTVYRMNAFNRKTEIDADSLGFVLYRNTRYNLPDAANSLITLDSAYRTNYTREKLFAPLSFATFPFKKQWLDPRLTVFEQKPVDTFLFSYDSMESHPALELRINRMKSYIGSEYTQQMRADTSFLNSIVYPAEFQVVESAYKALKYDKSLFQILHLMNRYPSHSYLISRATKILFDVSVAKNENLVHQYVSRFTGQYSEELRQVNNFLYNVTRKESAELAFALINNKNNFDQGDPSHYYLMWKVCELTARDNTLKSVAAAYAGKFHEDIAVFRYK